MKKTIFSLAAFVAAITACQVEKINENTAPAGEKYVIEASVASTKTIYDPPYSVSWTSGDALSVVPQYADGTYAGYEFKWTDGDSFVCENVSNPGEIEALNAIYPYDDFIKSIDSDGFENGYIYFGSRSDAAQTQNGTNDASHIAAPLYGYATVSAEGTTVVEMKHATTLFEVIVTNNAGKEISVANIKVTNSEDKNMIGQFYINPQTGALKEGQYVSPTANLNVNNGTIADNAKGSFYFTSAPFELSANSTLTVTITTGEGESTIVKNITEASAFEAGKVNHINVTVEEIETVEYMSVAEARQQTAGTSVNVEGIVGAVNAKSYMLVDATDNSTYLLAYKNSTPTEVKVGDKVQISGTMAEYGEMPQISSPVVNNVVSNAPVAYPEPVVLDGAGVNALAASPECKFIQFSGILNVSGSFYNIAIDGANYTGSISYPEEDLSGFNGMNITVTGYFNGITSGKYFNILITGIEGAPYCNVTPSVLNVTAEAGTTTFNISSNEYWMVESNNPAYTVSPEEGTGNATITVTYPANEGTDPVEVIFTILSESGVEKTVTLTQRVAGQVIEPTELFISEYVEGSANNKYIEIYNPTSNTIDLSDYTLEIYSNGKTTSTSVKLEGSIESKTALVYANSNANLYEVPKERKSGNISFNGEKGDAIALSKNGVNIDVWGIIGSTADYGKDVTMRRNPDVTGPSAEFIESQWTTYSKDDVSDLGKHTMNE